MEVVDLSTPKYPNRDALRQAHDIYLDAMREFVKIRDALEISPHDDIEKIIEISDIAHLVRTYWPNFKGHFDAVDPHYEARSAIGLIVEGRNRASHPPWDLDIEFTRTQLFLIAEVLEKIGMSAAQREVETIREKLFSDDTPERLAEAEKRLKEMEAENAEYKERLETKLKELKDTKETLAAAEMEKNGYKERFDATTKKLEEAKGKCSASEDSLKATSDRLEDAVDAWMASVERLTALQKLFTTAAIESQKVQAIFPPFETNSAVRILDRRDTDKRNYLSRLLDQKQPTLIYVQSEEKIDQLLDLVGPEKAAVIGKHSQQTSETEETEILKKLENKELIAAVSNATFSELQTSDCVEHFVFCHLAPSSDAFFDRCQPAFTSEKDTYLHLIYNSEQDIKRLVQKYPDREMLEKLYSALRKCAEINGNFIKVENFYSQLDIAKLSMETGLAIFEELQLLERNGEHIKLLPPTGKKLDESEIYCGGEKLKKETADFGDFQFEHSIEQIWEKMLEALNIDSEQILRESNIHKIPLRVSETEGDYLKDSQTQPEQSTAVVEKDSAVSQANKDKTRKKKPSIAERYTSETTEADRDELAVKIAKIRINATGSKPIAWRNIREKFGLKNDEFHKVIRLSAGYRKAVIYRIKQLKSRPEGWEYSGKLEVLTGIELSESELS